MHSSLVSNTSLLDRVKVGISYPLPLLSTSMSHVLLSKHNELLASQSYIQEPSNYRQASSDPIWIKSMEKDIEDIKQNNTWSVCSLPLEKTSLRCAWKYNLKLNPNGKIDKP